MSFVAQVLVITLTVDPDPRRGQHRRGVKHRVDVGPFKDLVYSRCIQILANYVNSFQPEGL